MSKKIYIIPSLLGESDPEKVIPSSIPKKIIPSLQIYFVENIRSARRYLKKICPDIKIDKLIFYEIGKHINNTEISSYENIIRNNDCGIMSEAGCPGIADPGKEIVQMGIAAGCQIIPLTGPSSILLAIMGSGLNGQKFTFNGYLPVKQNERIRQLKILEKHVKNEDCTQIFIETPYRNNALLDDIVNHCHPGTRLCIACELTTKNEWIKTKDIGTWKKLHNTQNKIDLHKKPVIFLIGK